MLSDREQRVLEELERNYGAEAADPPPRPGPQPRRGHWSHRTRGHNRSRAVVAVGVAGWISLLLLIAGAVSGALVLAVATALGWCLWRYRIALKSAGTVTGPHPERTGESQ